MINKSAAIIIKNKSVLYLRKRGFLFYILPGGKIGHYYNNGIYFVL